MRTTPIAYDIPDIRGYEKQVGSVLATYINPFGSSISVEQDGIKLIVDKGIEGDNHFGTRLSDSREDVLRKIGVGKEVPMSNVRQISIVSETSMQVIADNMGFPIGTGGPTQVNPTLLGANLFLEGIDVDGLPAGTLLCFATDKREGKWHLEWHKAVIAIWAPNEPCHIPNDNIIADMAARTTVPGGWKPSQPFGKAAKRHRGVVGFVYTSGKVKKADLCVAYSPKAHAEETGES